MNRWVSCLLPAVLSVAIFGMQPAAADSHTEKRVIVVFDEEVSEAEMEETLEDTGGEVEETYEAVEAAAAEVPVQAVDELLEDPDVAYVEEDILVTLNAQTVDWGIEATDTPRAWLSGFTGKGVKVAVIDSGIAPHSDLAIAGGISTVDYTTSYADDQGHGTHVAGIIAAQNNSIGVKGVAYGAELYAVKAFNQDGAAYLSDIIQGVDWSIQNDMDIINLSAGTQADSLAFKAVVDKAYASGLLVVAAAGNDGATDGSGDTIDYPARYPSVIAVGAVDRNLTRAVFSSTGPAVEVAAPGVSILSTYTENRYAYLSGTSMATPYVTGELALLMEAYPELTNQELRSVLIGLSKDLGASGRDPFYGYGLPLVTTFTEPIVTEAENRASFVTVSDNSLTGSVGDVLSVTAFAEFGDGTVRNVTAEAEWSSADTAVATATDGAVTLKGYGTTVISVTFDGQTAFINVTVPEPNPVTDLQVNQTAITAPLGEVIQVTLTAVYRNGEKRNVSGEAEWLSADPGIATVTDGIVGLTGYGSTTIMASFEGQSEVISVTVPEPVPEPEPEADVVDLETNRASVTGELGDTIALTASALLDDGTEVNVTEDAIWTSANTGIATVSDGRINLRGYGSTTVTVAHEGETASIAVDVPEPEPIPEPAPEPAPEPELNLVIGLEPAETTVTGEPGDIVQIGVSALFANGEVQVVTQEADWSSADTSVATAADGNIVLKTAGQTVIRVSYEGETAAIAVEVTESGPAPEPTPVTIHFEDVSSFYYPAVAYLVQQGITQGLSAEEFGVKENIKRADAAIWLARALDLDTEAAPASGFTDVPDRAAGAVNALKAAGIINGKTATQFGSQDPLSRGEVALILQRAYELEGDGNPVPFTDVSDRYREAVNALVANGVTDGISETRYGVSQNITRGQLAVFLYRLAGE
ncbi:S8 family peptidase [Indiicoccus explosivorum]|uniref:S8 family peptidase n=1 Tax=Indiicoccus explosivorum TaxID=1917864 RepID=UPI001186D1A5|nr:S8 family serine peptidase [Indiicoccus explosivorum]